MIPAMSKRFWRFRVLASGHMPRRICGHRPRRGLTLSWVRRSRIDGDSWEGIEVPLGESAEAYLLRVVDAAGLRREVTLGTPAFTYTGAMRASDGTTAPFTIEVAQMSDRFGPGPFARITIDD